MTNNRTRGRPRAFDTDTAVAAAAMAFWRNGYEGTSVTHLTEVMGISPQSLYAAFGSKEELYHRTLEWYATHAGAGPSTVMAAETDVVRAVEQMVLRTADDFRRRALPSGCMIATSALAMGDDSATVRDHLASMRRRRLATFRERLRQAVDEGQLSPELDIAAMARFLGAVVQGMSVQARDGATREELRGIGRLAVEELRRYRI